MARKKLGTLTEQMYYVLLALTKERHGYGVMQYISDLTHGQVTVGAGTLYALLARFEDEGLISLTNTWEGRKYYKLTHEGDQTLRREYQRLRRQVADGAAILDGKELTL